MTDKPRMTKALSIAITKGISDWVEHAAERRQLIGGDPTLGILNRIGEYVEVVDDEDVVSAPPEDRDTTAELLAAGWEHDDNDHFDLTPWRLPGISGRLSEDEAIKVLDGKKCPAYFCHGPGHQSMSGCELTGPHDWHEVHYWAGGGPRIVARWQTGTYTDRLRAKGIEFDPKSYPETIGMSGFFDEPPEED